MGVSLADDPYDLYITNDKCGDAIDYCTCFLYVQPSHQTEQLMQEWGKRINNIGAHENQASFNFAFRKFLNAPSSKYFNWAKLPQDKFPPGCTSNHSSPAVL